MMCAGNSVSFFNDDGVTFISLFDKIGNYDVFGVVPVLACIWIVVAILAFLILRYTIFAVTCLSSALVSTLPVFPVLKSARPSTWSTPWPV